MVVYLDTAIVIYAIEGQPSFKARAIARLADARAAGDDIATSYLTRGECLVKPVRTGDLLLQAEYLAFHLATAAHSRCDVFLTNDGRLSGFTGIRVDVLP